jgi:hypothetical protein
VDYRSEVKEDSETYDSKNASYDQTTADIVDTAESAANLSLQMATMAIPPTMMATKHAVSANGSDTSLRNVAN